MAKLFLDVNHGLTVLKQPGRVSVTQVVEPARRNRVLLDATPGLEIGSLEMSLTFLLPPEVSLDYCPAYGAHSALGLQEPGWVHACYAAGRLE